MNGILEEAGTSEVMGYPDAKLHIVYLGTGDLKHSVELVKYPNPVGVKISPTERNAIGAYHLGIVVDDLDALYEDLSTK